MMTKKKVNELIKLDFQENLSDYKFKTDLSTTRFEKNGKDHGFMIPFAINSFGQFQKIFALSGSMAIHRVESIIWSAKLNIGLVDSPYKKNEVFTIRVSQKISKVKQRVESEAEVKLVLEECKEILNDKILPFFEKYKDLESVADSIEKMERKFQVKFLGGYTFLLKRIVIMYLVNKQKLYVQYKEEAKEIYESQKNESEEDMNYYRTFNELINLLEGGKELIPLA